MKRYNKDRRAINKARTRTMRDTCDAQNTRKTPRIHIPIKYDGYAQTTYMKVIYGKTRNTKERTYVGVTNAINELFPEINAPHNAHTYRANAPYRKYILTGGIYRTPLHTFSDEPDRPRRHEGNGEPRSIQTETRMAKCIIFDADDRIIHYGWLRRTKKIYRDAPYIRIILHRNDRTLEVRPYMTGKKQIHGVDIAEIQAHDVEMYYIK